MSQAFKHVPWRVSQLVDDVEKGAVRLPDIQRPFVWRNTKVRDLVDSMYRGYPVGELMFWSNRGAGHTRSIGDGAKHHETTRQVIDGQQRLTSLYALLSGREILREDYSKETIRISFNPFLKRFEVPNSATDRSADWIHDVSTVFGNSTTARRSYFKRLRAEGREITDEEEEYLENVIDDLSRVKDYTFNVVELGEEVTRETIADIFVRINSEGVSLSSADFILTWMSVFWEGGREELETFARNSRFHPQEVSTLFGQKVSWTPRNAYLTFEPDQILRVAIAVGLWRAPLQDAYNYLRGRNPRTREIDTEQREHSLEQLKVGQREAVKPLHWDEFIKVLERAGFRNSSMISSKNTVLYSYALWIIGRVQFGVPIDELREIMARWFFMAQVTGRYTSSPETRMQEELNRLADIPKDSQAFLGLLNRQLEAAVPEDWWQVTLVDLLDTSGVRVPVWMAYVASLNILDADVLLSTSKVKDWITGETSVKGIERHHLFPRAYLKNELGITSTARINQVANFALVEWSDNIDISHKNPSTYWPQLIAEKQIEENRKTQQVQWHALPEGWDQLEYGEFLDRRRRQMAGVIREGFRKLADPNYEPTFAPGATSDPRGALPTFEALVLTGAINAGTLLHSGDQPDSVIAEVMEDGRIQVGEHLCDTVEQAAREANAEPGSGWDFWYIVDSNADEEIPLSAVRQQYADAP